MSVTALFRKDFVEETRRFRKYVLRIFYCGALLVAMLSILTAEKIDQARVAGELFETLARLQFFVASGLALTLGVMVLGMERSRGTLGLLMLTKLRPAEIITGAWLGRLVPMFFILACGMPFFVSIRVFGGVMLRDAAAVLGVTMLTVGFACALGIFLSLVTPNIFAAVSLGAAALAVLFWAPAYFDLGAAVFPLQSVEFIMSAGFKDVVQLNYLFAALAGGTFFMLTASAASIKSAIEGGRPVLPTLLDYVDGVLKKALPILYGSDAKEYDFRNPVMWRESRRGILGKRRHMVKLVLLAWGLLAALVFLVEPGMETHVSVLTAESTALILAAVFLGVSAVAREKESGALMLVLLTRQTPWLILWGKTASGLRILFYFSLVPGAHLGFAALQGAVHWICIPCFVAAFFTAAILFYAQGLVVALVTKSRAKALQTAMVLAVIEIGAFYTAGPLAFANPYYLVKYLVIAADSGQGHAYRTLEFFWKSGVKARTPQAQVLLFTFASFIVNLIIISLIVIFLERRIERIVQKQIEHTDYVRDALAEIRNAKESRRSAIEEKSDKKESPPGE